MSRKIFLDTFYRQFGDFLDQLTAAFPEDSDFRAYKVGLFLLQKTNPMIVPSEVVKHVVPFEATVRARDADFFMKYEFSEYADDSALDQVIRKLKNMWTTLSDNNKKVVWDYINLLLDLAKRCTSQ